MLPKTARRLSTSMCRPVLPQEQTSLLRAGTSASSGCEQLQQARPLFDHLIGTSALARPPSPREAYDFVHHAPQLRNQCLLNQGGFKTRPYESTSSNRC